MHEIKRKSPVVFPDTGNIESGEGPWIADLTHVPKWDIQDGKIGEVSPWDMPIPEKSGECLFREGLLISRMNRTQARVFVLDENKDADPGLNCATQITDGLCLLAIFGKDVFRVMERLTPLEVEIKDREPPYLIQGPVLHIPCQIIRMKGRDDVESVLIAFSRGYGRTMVNAVMETAKECRLKPLGEKKFQEIFLQ